MSQEAFNKETPNILAMEGGYVNDPNDRGGETYKGVARNANPGWPGWKIIDQLKRRGFVTAAQINAALKGNQEMDRYVDMLYKARYFDTVVGGTVVVPAGAAPRESAPNTSGCGSCAGKRAGAK